jgi:hypothetical protein
MGFKVFDKDLDDIERALRDEAKNTQNDLGNGLGSWGARTKLVAQGRTPVRTGDLRDSGQVSEPEKRQDGIMITIGFGAGKSEKYAVFVHDIPARHEVGTDRFLEKAVEQMAVVLLSDIARGF